ncbi:type II toxin-antitoxin system RelE/ParE family toxin [Streptomyces platensis]|nr:type II toxin-antitoxin system RelE/ParE family toxin [Streptomyces glebosus]
MTWGARFLKDDPGGLRQLMDPVDLLADQPRPEGTAEYRSTELRRMHVGRHRVLYEITWRSDVEDGYSPDPDSPI